MGLQQSRDDQMAERASREIAEALAILAVKGHLGIGVDLAQKYQRPDRTRAEREAMVFMALAATVTPPVAQRFDRHDTICAAGKLHMTGLPLGVLLRVPLPILNYLAIGMSGDAKPDPGRADACPRR